MGKVNIGGDGRKGREKMEKYCWGGLKKKKEPFPLGQKWRKNQQTHTTRALGGWGFLGGGGGEKKKKKKKPRSKPEGA